MAAPGTCRSNAITAKATPSIAHRPAASPSMPSEKLTTFISATSHSTVRNPPSWGNCRAPTNGTVTSVTTAPPSTAIDDARNLAPALKLVGQIGAAVIAVEGGAVVTDVTVPFVGALQFPHEGGFLTVLWLVALMNVVNFSDGIDGLAAGLCAIDGVAFAVIAFDLHVPGAAILAALTAGASIGFLFHNYHPARVMMGDSGANLLGYLLGVAAVVGSLKTNAVVALVVPLVILAVPFLDTSFVIAKRLKYRRKVWLGDANHFHHRMARIGFSQRKTVAYLYGWSTLLAGVAVALRFVPYSDHHHHYRSGWLAFMIALGLTAVAASIYLVYVLEILKFKSFRVRELRRSSPETGEHEL